jgi:hypothetical protein
MKNLDKCDYRIIAPKQCSCGVVHTGKRVQGIYQDKVGLWVDCECKSTMLIPEGGFCKIIEPSKRGERRRRYDKQAKPKSATTNKSIITEYYLVLKGA